ncbi:CMP-N-acetylneuraminate-beta-galactosamide-alpha-2,3-sialyltransferase 1-like [Plectropomus leopardus]|uniref:CMP-N-acetylneuraminate-beta-galactosamide- alpha-2,3-sialyltransferase 1-like n=1 Tax=Plectropomus leopardus TaxID=160734 RepID=UPI001C4AA9BF|nr:CMP-N-acetylneuraminate-beta-galactosamide-alpha-2,3-sialyltransferase 1-like [Plectropomus leopardus]
MWRRGNRQRFALIHLQERQPAEMLSRLGYIKIFISLLCMAAIGLFSTPSWDLSIFSFGLQNSSLCACQNCMTEGDPWFTARMKASPQPFLSKTYEPLENDFKWWRRIQFERRNFTVYKSTLAKLFQIFPPVPDVVEHSPDHCTTCAVVGNSGNLNGSRYGPLIDFHDMVIRMNRGRTKGYEADVGSKTTHHVMYPNSATTLDNTTHLVFFPFKISHLLWLFNKFDPGENRSVNSKRIANKDLVMILNPAFIKYVHTTWLGKNGAYPSTGFLTVALSLQICDEVSVFGFGADKKGNWNHYFEILRQKKLRTGQHAGSHEYRLIQRLQEKKKIVFFKGF